MTIDQIYTGCLAQGAYYIECSGEAAIIDPLRSPEPYIERAAKDGAKIKYIFETHFHADFVSGHLDLAKKTGATIVYGPGAKTDYDKHEATDGEDVYPAHGAGSACGKKMSSETQDTLGNQKATNYALRADMTREEFIKEVTDGLLPPPAYFGENVRMNKEGYESFSDVMKTGNVALSPADFERVANAERPLILDVRAKEDFVVGFVPNSIFIGLDGSFAPWAGEMIPDLSQPILLVTDPGREAEAVERLSRVGYDNTLGYLAGGIAAWKAYGGEIDTIATIKADTFGEALSFGAAKHIIDARKPTEFANGHLSIATNLPLAELNSRMAEIAKEETVYVHCGSGYRSTIATSLLKSRGYEKVVNVQDKVGDILALEVV